MMLRIEPAGYQVALAHALREAWDGPLDVVFLTLNKTQAWALGPENDGFHTLPSSIAIRSLRERIAKTKPSLLHTAGWTAPACLAAILMGNALGLPVIVDLDTWSESPSFWRGPLKRLVYPRLFRLVTHFGPGGQRQAAYLRRFGVSSGKITPINMTVDVMAIRRTLSQEPDARQAFRDRFGIPAEAPLALFIGRLVAIKGIDDLLTAWPKVVAETPSARLVIAGDGELRSRVAAAAATDPSILPIGRLSGLDVWRAYAAADYVVAPSHREPWGLVVNEAMAAGAPVIVTGIFGCVGDLARDEDTALVIPPASPEQLAQAMRRLTRDPVMRLRLSKAASAVISDWTIEAEAQKIIAIWRRALGARADAADHPGRHQNLVTE
ncbi:MAG: glycosyltransferase family 4 protein [Rhodomicrobium sp.]